MSEKVTITQIKRTPRTSKSGRPFISVGIMTKEHGEKWLSGFASKENESWAVGSEVEIDIEKKGEYLNFSVPKNENGTLKLGGGSARLENLISFEVIPALKRIATALELLANMGEGITPSKYPKRDSTNDMSPLEDSPFND